MDDPVDLAIVRAVSRDARATLADISRAVGLSVSAVQARLRRLESSGVIAGYRALLLQTFDEYVVGYRATRSLLDVAGISNMVGPEWGTDGHPVVLDSQVVGHWRYRAEGRGRGAPVVVRVVPRAGLGAADAEAIGEEVARFGAYLGRDTSLELARPR